MPLREMGSLVFPVSVLSAVHLVSPRIMSGDSVGPPGQHVCVISFPHCDPERGLWPVRGNLQVWLPQILSAKERRARGDTLTRNAVTQGQQKEMTMAVCHWNHSGTFHSSLGFKMTFSVPREPDCQLWSPIVLQGPSTFFLLPSFPSLLLSFFLADCSSVSPSPPDTPMERHSEHRSRD